ncbi:site-specific integrase [Lactococcus petauri]|jgi:integrase|uniref:tyrosine-type recombinase/integrase n=1 Tax=Lactococcus TaxID=1357 RepID=UPI0002E89C7B|nr:MULTISPECIES: site-specific integrase [Lactococcus]KKF91802.1 integrase [Lactococcus garvieae]MBS4460432.1 site-specific integrase [Lactococcus petauri]MBS4463982.1 site-specific integrase [Lactococcus garvieae]MDG6111744.1 site-specific integrase [Lactococcus formosensis]MDG6117944.1 site-specific integrase [Lactococcus formosensis]
MNIKEITKKDGTIAYRASIYLGVDSLTGKQVRTTATAKTRKQCEIKANQAINKFNKNGCTVAREKVVFKDFEELALSWFESYKLTVKENSIRVAENFLNVYLLPSIGSYKLDRINTVLLQGIINKWARNANTATIINGRREKGKCKDYKLLLNFITRILDYGIQLGAIDSNPAKQVIPPKLKARTSQKIKYFDNGELKKFLKYLDNLETTAENQRIATLYKLLLATGLRVGEALALNWSDIDFKDNYINVSKTIVQKSRSIQNTPKTKESGRVIFLDDSTVHILKEWKRTQQKGVISFHDELVFSYNKISRTYACEREKLIQHFKKASVPNIGFHGFRHTHASLLMNNDVNPKEIQHRLGHSDYGVTMNTYSHLAKHKEKDTAEKFGNILKAL